ncbi:MAG: flagellar basal body-associated FliL family protein [Proteobacteria bacterium]|nr:flagellar basal body-associated FliL family protein [Pseudomonadota bacterium]
MAAEATEDLGEGAAGAPETKRFAGKKLILFIVLPLLLLIGGAAGVFFSGILGGGAKKAEHEAPHEEAAPKPAAKQTVFFDLPDIVVNLNATNRRTNFLKISVSLELEQSGDIEVITQNMPRIIDNFQVYLRELRIDDLQGSAGLYRLREELLRRVNLAARPVRVRDVLFKEMLVQ